MALISKQAYHQYRLAHSKKKDVQQEIIEKVFQARNTKMYKNMGARPLYYALEIKETGINQFEKLLSVNELNVQVKRKRIQTTQGVHGENDINRVMGLKIYDINKVIVGDITYLFVGEDLYYIFSLKDAYSKRLVGLYGSKTMRAIDGCKCLKQVIKTRGKDNLKECIHHSDAGSQYKSHLYRNTAIYLNWSIADNCLENGMAEQLNFILKSHYLENEKILNAGQLNRLLKKVKEWINESRPVKALGYKTPIAFEIGLENIPIEQRKPFCFSSFEGQKGDFGKGIGVKERFKK